MQRQIGVYVQEQAKLFDKLVVVLGGRYDFAKTEFKEDAVNTRIKTEDSAFTGRAGLVYLFDNGLAPYASYSESFQPQLGDRCRRQSVQAGRGPAVRGRAQIPAAGLEQLRDLVRSSTWSSRTC